MIRGIGGGGGGTQDYFRTLQDHAPRDFGVVHVAGNDAGEPADRRVGNGKQAVFTEMIQPRGQEIAGAGLAGQPGELPVVEDHIAAGTQDNARQKVPARKPVDAFHDVQGHIGFGVLRGLAEPLDFRPVGADGSRPPLGRRDRRAGDLQSEFRERHQARPVFAGAAPDQFASGVDVFPQGVGQKISRRIKCANHAGLHAGRPVGLNFGAPRFNPGRDRGIEGGSVLRECLIARPARKRAGGGHPDARHECEASSQTRRAGFHV